MSTSEGKPCIPPEMIPTEGVTQVTDPKTGAPVLLVNEVMFTAYQHSQGSLSKRFFIPLRDQAQIMGAQCTECGQIICPPFQLLCPECNFAKMELVKLPDRGVMMASAPITLYASALAKEFAPFARGYVLLGSAGTGLNVLCRTTTGIIRPGIFVKGTSVKVVFKDQRQGLITDICVVPESELNAKQIEKSPLLESEVDWQAAQRPTFNKTVIAEENLQTLLGLVEEMQQKIAQSQRARADLQGWEVVIQCYSAAGMFTLTIKDATLLFAVGSVENPTFELAVEDPGAFIEWWHDRDQALTNLLMEGTIWTNRGGTVVLETFFRLDRLPRSLRREVE